MQIKTFFREHYLAIKPSTSARTVKLYSASIRKLLQYLGREPVLSDFTNEVIGKYLAALSRTKLAVATVNKERYQLLAMWRLGTPPVSPFNSQNVNRSCFNS